MPTVFQGDGDDNVLRGTEEGDLMYGAGGNDKLHGGGGADTMFGGLGDDRYWVDSFSDAAGYDIVGENAGEGYDIVFASVSYMLPENVERLILMGSADIDGFGNGGDDRINGNAGSNNIYGLGGDDTLTGGAGADNVYGGADNDRLISSGGGDFLGGGEGDDVYFMNDADDYFYEYEGQGYDVVFSSVDQVYSSHIEKLVLLGDAPLNVDGYQDISAFIVGNAGNNTIVGRNLGDRLIGGAGDDSLLGGTGMGSSGDDTLVGGDGSDALFGYDGNDRLVAGATDDQDDFLQGGIGDDRYVVSDIYDYAYEMPGRGYDTVVVKGPGYSNSANIERVVIKGMGDSIAQGWSHNEKIIGDNYANELWGCGGDDTLKGGAGDDTVYGDFPISPSSVPNEYGDPGDDLLRGGAGDDLLVGGRGNDILIAEAGSNLLVGGYSDGHLPPDNEDPNFSAGADRYVVAPLEGAFSEVYVVDFSLTDGDKIDLRGIDADPSTPEDDAFAFWDGPPRESGGWLWLDDTMSGPRIRGTLADGSDAGFSIGLYTPGYEITDLTEAHFAL